MVTSFFFRILVALLPCTITGYSFQAISVEDDVTEVTVKNKDDIKFGNVIKVNYEFSPLYGKDASVILQKKRPNYRMVRKNTRKRTDRRNRTRTKGGREAKEDTIEGDAIRGTVDDEFHWETVFYQYTCDDVAYNYTDCEQIQLEDKLKFDMDKGQSYDISLDAYWDSYSYYSRSPNSYRWPPSNGEWRACPSLENFQFDVIGKCDNFTIDAVPDKILKKMVIAPKEKDGYDVNAPIKVKFNIKEEYDNAWVGIYDEAQMMLDKDGKGKHKPKNKLAYYAWAFTGCDTTIGDLDNGSCSTIEIKGDLELPPVGSGEYYLCLSLDFDDDNVDNMKCTKKSFSIDGENEVIKKMKKSYDFGDKITVVWENPNDPAKANYAIHIYIAEYDGADFEYYFGNIYGNLAFRKSACIEVEPPNYNYAINYACDEPLKRGSFVFSERTTGIVQNEVQWPPPSGDYQVCLVDETEDPYVTIGCERFKIDPLSDDVLEAVEVTVNEAEIEELAEVTGSWTSPLKATANMWLAVYSDYDIGDDNKPMYDGQYWRQKVWAASECNGPDQLDHPYEGCPYKKKEGDFVFSGLERGKYKICLLFDFNWPYQYISDCSNEFEVIAPPTPAPTPTPTPAPTPTPTTAPTPTPTPALTPTPTPAPTPAPTSAPTTVSPTTTPTALTPSTTPTALTPSPTPAPTPALTTVSPTTTPTALTPSPTTAPTPTPTPAPTTVSPTTTSPTDSPTWTPTMTTSPTSCPDGQKLLEVELNIRNNGANYDWRLYNVQNDEDILVKRDSYTATLYQERYCIEPQCLKLIIFEDWDQEEGYDYDYDFLDYADCGNYENSSFKFTYDGEVILARNYICDNARSEAITSNLFGC